VLAWAVAGWDDYQHRGRLDPPAAVSDATSTYRISNDNIAAFIDDRCLLDPHAHVVSGDLWSQWEAWCHANSQRPGTNRMLKAALESRGVSYSRSNATSFMQFCHRPALAALVTFGVVGRYERIGSAAVLHLGSVRRVKRAGLQPSKASGGSFQSYGDHVAGLEGS
jgi:phage/plasmid-associated DNA primase